MIARLRTGLAQFFQDPLGALVGLRDTVPTAPVAAMCLALATLVLVLIDMTYGPLAFPHTVEPGGKRASGAAIVAAVELARIYAVSAVFWIGGKYMIDPSPSGALAMWLTLPYAIALIGFELAQAATWLLALLFGLQIYGPIFTIGFVATLLVLVVSVRALAPEKDWLACLPLAAIAFLAGHYLAPFVLLLAGVFLIVEKAK